MNIHMIWAQDTNNAIGRNGTLPWYFPEDLKNFKRLTTRKIIIMGRSLGSASAAHTIHKNQDIIDGCVIESGFATEIPLLKLYNIDPDTIGFKLTDGFENLRKFKQYSKPLYVIHADLDTIIPFSQAEIIILENKSKMKDLFRVSGADHNNIFHIAREDYFSNIKKFIDTI